MLEETLIRETDTTLRPRAGNRFRRIASYTALIAVSLFAVISILTASWREERVLRHASLKELEEITRQRPGEGRAFYYLARRATAASEYDLADHAYARAAAQDLDAEDIWLAWAGLAQTQARYERAFGILNWFVRRHPSSERAHLLLAELWQQTDAPLPAYDEAMIAVHLSPKDLHAWQIAGEEALKSRHLPEAERCLRSAIALSSQDWQSKMRLGYALFHQERGDESEDACRQAILIAPAEADPHLALGTMLLARAKSPIQIAAAQQELIRATQLAPTSARAYFYLGRSYFRQGDAARAAQALELARQRDPEDPEVYYELARSYHALGKNAEAERARAVHQRLLISLRKKQLRQELLKQRAE